MNDLGTGTPQTEAASAIAKRSAARDALLDLKARIGKSVLGQGHLLLEAMEERQVTVAGKTYKMPDLFLVLATENPIEQEGPITPMRSANTPMTGNPRSESSTRHGTRRRRKTGPSST